MKGKEDKFRVKSNQDKLLPPLRAPSAPGFTPLFRVTPAIGSPFSSDQRDQSPDSLIKPLAETRPSGIIFLNTKVEMKLEENERVVYLSVQINRNLQIYRNCFIFVIALVCRLFEIRRYRSKMDFSSSSILLFIDLFIF